MVEVSAFIDWLSVTHHKAIEGSHEGIAETPQPCRGIIGYTSGIVYPSGAIELWSEKRPDMGHHYIYSGKVLQRIADRYETSRDEILSFHTQFKGRVSRIDFAIDVRDSNLDLDTLWKQLESGDAKTLSKHTRTQSGNNKGTTVYVGSLKNRKKLLRAYDKAKEVGDFIADYKRIELELHSTSATNGSKLYENSSSKPETILSFIRAFVDFPSYSVWREIFSEKPLSVPTGTHQLSDTERWLLQIVAPAYARVLADNKDFHTTFMEAVAVKYNQSG